MTSSALAVPLTPTYIIPRPVNAWIVIMPMRRGREIEPDRTQSTSAAPKTTNIAVHAAARAGGRSPAASRLIVGTPTTSQVANAAQLSHRSARTRLLYVPRQAEDVCRKSWIETMTSGRCVRDRRRAQSRHDATTARCPHRRRLDRAGVHARSHDCRERRSHSPARRLGLRRVDGRCLGDRADHERRPSAVRSAARRRRRSGASCSSWRC